LVDSVTGVPGGAEGVTETMFPAFLLNDTTYTWRARAYDGDRYGEWMDTASFTVHLPLLNLTATMDFDPDTVSVKSNGTWVTVYIELPSGHSAHDIDVSSILFEGAVPAEPRPYEKGDYDDDGIADLKVKFRRSKVIEVLGEGEYTAVHVSGKVGTSTFDGVDYIRILR
jgi:large repetitive protein